MATKQVKFVPKKDKRVSKYEAVLQTLLKKGVATYPMAKNVPERIAAHRVYISLHALLTRRTGKAPKTLSVRIGEKRLLGITLIKGPK